MSTITLICVYSSGPKAVITAAQKSQICLKTKIFVELQEIYLMVISERCGQKMREKGRFTRCVLNRVVQYACIRLFCVTRVWHISPLKKRE